ncbi:carbohydrate sulfotransferase 1-like isoform X2 [Liolophura sinensis]
MAAILVWSSIDVPSSVSRFLIEGRADVQKVFRVDSPKKVLIVAYYRSGSSLTGSVFNDNDEAFYLFEPLYSLYSFKNELRYFNGSTRPWPRDPDSLRMTAVNILASIFKCRLADVDVVTWTRMMCQIGTRTSKEFCECKKGKSPPEILRDCMANYTARCENAKYRVVKTIRSDMAEVRSLLKIVPDLKVIHLQRDPRGMLCSKLFSKHCSVTRVQIDQLCDRLTMDLRDRHSLEKHYPTSFMQVIYEDIVEDAIAEAGDMYKFVAGNLPHAIKAILQDKTKYGGKYDGAYGTYRKNGLQTAYNWTVMITWNTNEAVQNSCFAVLKNGKFPILNNPTELQKFKIPDRRKFRKN